MTPGEVHMALTALQLERAGGGKPPLLWTRIEPADDDGRNFIVCVRFDDEGPDLQLPLTLAAAIDAHDDEAIARLDAAITDAAPTRWMQ